MATARFEGGVAVLVAALVWIAGCGTTRQEKAAGRASGVVPTYTAQIAPIIKARCSPCHFPGGTMYIVVPLDTYDRVKMRASMVRLDVYVRRTMPLEGTMPDSERTLVARWVDTRTPE